MILKVTKPCRKQLLNYMAFLICISLKLSVIRFTTEFSRTGQYMKKQISVV